jgi:hypothetical protein
MSCQSGRSLEAVEVVQSPWRGTDDAAAVAADPVYEAPVGRPDESLPEQGGDPRLQPRAYRQVPAPGKCGRRAASSASASLQHRENRVEGTRVAASTDQQCCPGWHHDLDRHRYGTWLGRILIKRTARNRKGMGRRSVVEFWGPTGGDPPQGSNLRALEPRGHARFVFRARIPRGGRFRFVVSAGDIDSGTGKGTAFRAFSVGFRYFGEKCREASVLRRGYRKAKGIICGNVESGRKSFGA